MPSKGKKKPSIKEDLDKTFAKVEQLSAEFNLGDAFYQAGGLRPIGEQYPILAGLVNQLESVTAKITNPSENPDGGLLPPYFLENMYEYIEIIDRLVDSVREVLTKEAKGKKTFAMPSHDIMLSLICIFSGKPTRLPKWLLDKPAELRTPEEKQQAKEFVNSIIQQDTHIDYGLDGKAIEETSYYSIIADNPKVKAWTGIEGTLFENDLITKGEALAAAIKRTYGPEGLKHLLAFIIALDEAGRSGTIFWKVNEHLDRLGKRQNKQKRAYKTEDRQRALEILKILISLVLNLENKTGKRERIQAMRLFSIDGFEVEKLDQQVINETIVLRATDIWYRNAITPPNGRAPMFTQLLKKIAQEYHKNHPLTIFMAPLFAIMWRINVDKDGWKLSVENLMKWCNLETKGPNVSHNYKDMLTELDYMKEAGYLGAWDLEPREGGKYQAMLTLTPPDWLKETNKAIANKRVLSLPEGQQQKPLTQEEFTKIFKASELNQKQFANTLGVSQQTVGFILTGARKPSRKLSDKVREVYPQQG